MTERACRYYNLPSGCTNTRCSFAHIPTLKTLAATTTQASRDTRSLSPTDTFSRPRSATVGSGSNPRAPHGVCRVYWSSGRCPYGARCRHTHVEPGTPDTPNGFGSNPSAASPRSPPAPYSPSLSPTQELNRGFPSSPTRTTLFATSAPPRPPHEACTFYWNNGACHREFRCHYDHVTPSAVPLIDRGLLSDDRSDAGDIAQVVASVLATNTDSLFTLSKPLSPNEAHNRLRGYLADHFTFKWAQEVYDFWWALGSSNAFHADWKIEDGQLLMDAIATVGGNGLKRLQDIIQWPDISLHAGKSTKTMSFQRGFVPLLGYLSSDAVIHSTVYSNITTLYSLIHENFAKFSKTIEDNLNMALSAKSFNDPNKVHGHIGTINGVQLFKAIFTVLSEYLTRYKDAALTDTNLRNFVRNVAASYRKWSDGIMKTPPTFDDPWEGFQEEGSREFLTSYLTQKADTLLKIINGVTIDPTGHHGATKLKNGSDPILEELRHDYVGPGEHRPEGPRHDNDFVDIRAIQIIPTQEELLCDLPRFIPANIPGAPHPFPPDSMHRLLDVQFRLLREEMNTSYRRLGSVLSELGSKDQPLISQIMQGKGGILLDPDVYSGDMVIYTNIIPSDMKLSPHGLAVVFEVDQPPKGTRPLHWDGLSQTKLLWGTLVAFITRSESGATQNGIFFGVISGPPGERKDTPPGMPGRYEITVSFFDQALKSSLLRTLVHPHVGLPGTSILIEFAHQTLGLIPTCLETLRVEPTTFPFTRYLAHPGSGTLSSMRIRPPSYATAPGFTFELQSLLQDGRGQSLKLNVNDSASILAARQRLKKSGRFDVDQAKAVVDALTREVSVITGPPGTGKSFIGGEILRALIAKGTKPVLLALTNQALDSILRIIVDSDVTTNIVRLGWVAETDKLSEFCLGAKMSALGPQTRLYDAMSQERRQLKVIEAELAKLMKNILRRGAPAATLDHIMTSSNPRLKESLLSPPPWIQAIFHLKAALSNPKQSQNQKPGDDALFDFWRSFEDLILLEHHYTPSSSTPSTSLDVRNSSTYGFDGIDEFFARFGFAQRPECPCTDRSLRELLLASDIWSFSIMERTTLTMHLNELLEQSDTSLQSTLVNLQQKYTAVYERMTGIKEQICRQIMKDASLIASTSLDAQVMVIEDAGQMQEAHCLSNILPSLQHLIMIGDPQQLRPTLECRRLTVDDPDEGSRLFRFDDSLVTRLSRLGLPTSKLNTQYRMRPSISRLLRDTQYPALKDNRDLAKMGPVIGMSKDVFFLDQIRVEDEATEDVSGQIHSAVQHLKDLLLHLLRPQHYDEEGDIAVLLLSPDPFAYLRRGQNLEKQVARLIELDAHSSTSFDPLKGAQKAAEVKEKVYWRSVDNFPGQEAKVIILWLLEAKADEGGQSAHSSYSTEFAKARVNVALSRAREGLYILGDAQVLEGRSELWAQILKELRSEDAVGKEWPMK
ncbi:hypothetical protein BOTBODRAFT_50246 [Botryobasidium botryosum FD-172 SS1]|uniref:C3H1-type domain-containing protein n=1 Tax=Botryobasidium botryosum (strain FD-172 SS1) TaxID=930990 RepID=A0A067N1C2_BOTB1|nr:hypothetical protein BOTBODRAFT_50246 [Botryobasidium botryosum FD-172 SS1]